MAKKSDEIKFATPQKYETRNKNRCPVCGRSRGYMRRFGLCRICFRERALAGEIPGVLKISW
jgi:small subunit ribosomal protein S14